MTPSQAISLQARRPPLAPWMQPRKAPARAPRVTAPTRANNRAAERILVVLARMGAGGERLRTLAELSHRAGLATTNPSASAAAALWTLRGRGEVEVRGNPDLTRTYRLRSGVEVRTL